MTESVNARDEAFQAYWKRRSRTIAPSMLDSSRLAMQQAWEAAWNHRDWNGPDEALARMHPLPGDKWAKHTTSGVSIKRIIMHYTKGLISFDQMRGYRDFSQDKVQVESFRRWSKTARLEQRGTRGK